MATLQIEIRDGKIISHNGVNVEVANETHIEGNGWVGNIYENGEIAFVATDFYSDVRHQLKFKIRNGYVKKLLKIGNGQPKILKAYKIQDWPVDGVVGLSGGYVDKRVCYFRISSFQKFLDEYQLTAVRCESANAIYRLVSGYNGDTLIFNEELETDGRSNVFSVPSKYDKHAEVNSNTTSQMIEITDASWAIKTVREFGKVKHRILYTLDNPQEIIGLPKLK